jgi:putative ABC transport system permease protein
MFRRKRKPSDFSAEIEAHIQLEAERLREQGLSEEEARAAARRAFGNVMQREEHFYESSRWLWWDHLLRDMRFGLRMLARDPGFTCAVVFTLALSIGANTAIFSIVDALLLKDLPYANPSRLGTICVRTIRSDSSDLHRNIDGEQWELLRDNVSSLLSGAYAKRVTGVNLQSGSHIQYLHAGRISAHYLDVIGIHPIVGRNFSEDEDRPHGPSAAILSYSLWRAVFGSNPDIVGQAVLLKGEPFTIVGILPENAMTPLSADLYMALKANRDGEGKGTNFETITRLRDAATWQQADAEINHAWANAQTTQRLAKDNPGAPVSYYSLPLQKGETSSLRPQALTLMLAAGMILLIACANLAGLSLVRMLRRVPEIATRLSLGASPWQIQRQFWTENLLLALVGGVAGVGVGFIALRALLVLLPEHFLPVALVPLDGRALTFTLFLALLASVLFGMLPALTTGRADLRSAVASRSVIGARGVRLRQGLIACEVALTVVLLAASGLLIRTLIHLETLPPGFNPNGVIAAKASLDDVRYHDPATFRKLLDESLDAMRRIPGVQSAAIGLSVPYERALIEGGITISDGSEMGQELAADSLYVTPGYFPTLQIPILMGRDFADSDGPTTQPVVIVNQTFVRKFFQRSNPVGRHLNKMVIVGVVGDTLLSSASKLNADAAPLTYEETLYLPAAQIVEPKFLAILHTWFQPSWILRTAKPMEGLNSEMQRGMGSVDSNLPFSGFYDMKDLMITTLATQRIEVALLATMASLALILSAVGIFALVANLVVQRTREIGIRIALGSTIREAMVHIGSSGARASILGLAVGLILSAGALRALRSVIYGVGVYDVPTILAVVLTLVLVTLLASSVPTLRIARIDPAKTLREE